MTHTPDFFQPLEAWRKFDAVDRGRVLVSVAHGGAWTVTDPGAAYCAGQSETHVDEPCPSLKCTCGYYAYKTREQAELHGQGYILARVEVWGRIAEHANGYRAERMRLKELFLLDGDSIPPEVYDVTTDRMIKRGNGDKDALALRYLIPVSIVKGQTAWTSENPNASSSLNPSVSQLLSQSNYQVAYQNHLNSYLPQVNQAVTSSQPVTIASGGSTFLYRTVINIAYAYSWSPVTWSYTTSNWRDAPTKAPKRQYFDFTDS